MTVPPIASFLSDTNSPQNGGVPPLSSFLSDTGAVLPVDVTAAPVADQATVPNLATARGREAQEATDVSAQSMFFQELLAQPERAPGQHDRIRRIMANNKTVSLADVLPGASPDGILGSIELTNRVTDRRRTAASNYTRGAVAGTVNFGMLGPADLAIAAAQTVMPKSLEHILGLPEWRDRVAEAQAAFREIMDPQGVAGFAGTATGAILGPVALSKAAGVAGAPVAVQEALNPWQVLNSAGMQGLMRLSPRIAAVVVSGTKPGATYGQRLLANLVGSGAVDAFQIFDVMTDDRIPDGPEGDAQRLSAIAMTALMSGGSAAISSLRAVKPDAAPPKPTPDATKPTTPPPDAGGTPPVDRAAQAAELVEKAKVSANNAAEERRLVAFTKAFFEQLEKQIGGTRKWKDLPAEEKQRLIAITRARRDQIRGDMSKVVTPPPVEAPPVVDAGTPPEPPPIAPLGAKIETPPEATPAEPKITIVDHTPKPTAKAFDYQVNDAAGNVTDHRITSIDDLRSLLNDLTNKALDDKTPLDDANEYAGHISDLKQAAIEAGFDPKEIDALWKESTKVSNTNSDNFEPIVWADQTPTGRHVDVTLNSVEEVKRFHQELYERYTKALEGGSPDKQRYENSLKDFEEVANDLGIRLVRNEIPNRGKAQQSPIDQVINSPIQLKRPNGDLMNFNTVQDALDYMSRLRQIEQSARNEKKPKLARDARNELSDLAELVRERIEVMASNTPEGQLKPFTFQTPEGEDVFIDSMDRANQLYEDMANNADEASFAGNEELAKHIRKSAQILDKMVKAAGGLIDVSHGAKPEDFTPPPSPSPTITPPGNAPSVPDSDLGNLRSLWFRTTNGLVMRFKTLNDLARHIIGWEESLASGKLREVERGPIETFLERAKALYAKAVEDAELKITTSDGGITVFDNVRDLKTKMEAARIFLEEVRNMDSENMMRPADDEIAFMEEIYSGMQDLYQNKVIRMADPGGTPDDPMEFAGPRDLANQIARWKSELKLASQDFVKNELNLLIHRAEQLYNKITRADTSKLTTIDEIAPTEIKGQSLPDGTPYDVNDEVELATLIQQYRKRLASAKSPASQKASQEAIDILRAALDRLIDDRETLKNVKVMDQSEFDALHPDAQKEVFNQMASELRQARAQRDEAIRAAQTDGLTGLGNQAAWLRAVESVANDPTVEFVMFDLMNLKAMNDLQGQTEGNKYIMDRAAALRTAMHAIGVPERLFRIGGDEFGAIVPKGKGEEFIKQAIELSNTQQKVGGYQLGIRGATGNSVTEVEANLNAVKTSETHSKLRVIKAKQEANATAKKQNEDFFGLPLKKAFSKLTVDELDKLIDKLDERLETKKISEDDYVKALDQIAQQKKLVRPAAPAAPKADVQAPIDPSTPQIIAKPAAPKEPEIRTDPAMARKFMSGKIRDMDISTLHQSLDYVEREIALRPGVEAKEMGLTKRRADIIEELARRAKPPGPGGITASLRPETIGVAAGIAAGLMDPETEDQRNLQLALYTIAAIGIGGPQVIKRISQIQAENVPKYQQNIRKKVKSVEDAPLESRDRFKTRLMRAYEAIARRDLPITNVTKLIGGRDLPASRNPGKRAEIFGLWRQQADVWMGFARGNGIGYWDNNGTWVPLDAVPLSEVSKIAEGDLRTVGDLSAARRELELRGQSPPRTLGLELEDSRLMYAKTAEKYHRAADELTKLFRALARSSVDAGLLSEETFKKFQADVFYVAVRRLFHNEPGTQPSTISVAGNRKSGTGPQNMFKFLLGSKRPFQNPVEAFVELAPRYMKAQELNRLATFFFDQLQAVDETTRAGIARKLTKSETPQIADQEAKIAAIKQELESVGNTISSDEALAIVTALSDESLNVTSDVVRFYRDGKLEAWRVSDPVARAFRSLQPFELEAVMEGAGILTKPTQFARVGITGNPVFIGRQAIRDIWQYHMNGSYGVDPTSSMITKIAQSPISLMMSGVGSLRGYLHQMFGTGEYRNFVAAGGGGDSIASQGLRVVRGDIKSREGVEILNKIKEPTSRNQIEQIAKETIRLIKEPKLGNLRELYASIMQPIADAGRVGAYLQERGRGHDVLEAVWRAKKAGANFNNRGSWLTLRAIDRMSLFLNPSIQGMDASRYAFQRDPTGYIIRGIAGIALPSLYLWMANKDDEEIQQLRATDAGSRYWFTRDSDGSIVKIAKPILDGQIFGTTVEAWMDQKYKEDPLAWERAIEAISEDASMNLLPFIGVAPVSFWANKKAGVGAPIVPQYAEGLDQEYRAGPDASMTSRLVSEYTAPAIRKYAGPFQGTMSNVLSPAGLDFIISTYLGGSGTEAVKLLEESVKMAHTGMVPAAQELPFVRQFFPRYPSMNTQAIQEFYTMADRYENAMQTVNYLAETQPSKLDAYISERQTDIILGQLYTEQRAKIGDITRAMRDIQMASPEIMSAADKKMLSEELMREAIRYATEVNQVARQIVSEGSGKSPSQ